MSVNATSKSLKALFFVLTLFSITVATAQKEEDQKRNNNAGFYLLKNADLFFSKGHMVTAKDAYMENIAYLSDQQKINLSTILLTAAKAKEEDLVFKLLKTVQDQNNLTVKALLGRLYSHGTKTIKRDSLKSARLLEESVKGNDAWGYYYTGFESLMSSRYEDCMAQLKKSAALGNALAMNNIGLLYQSGIGVVQNYDSAIYWYQKSAALGNGMSNTSIATLYYTGKGVERNYETAFRNFDLANKNEDLTYAQLSGLGSCYLYGQGVAQNTDSSLHYFALSAINGNANGFTKMGFIYEHFKARNKVTLDSAIQFYLLGIAQGDLDAYSYLGYIYTQSNIIPHDYVLAAKILKEGADRGNPTSMVSYALLYKDGNGVKKDWNKYIALLKQAASMGSYYASDLLGIAFRDINNYDEAKKYFLLAIEGNNSDAMLNYAKLLQQENPSNPAITEYLSKAANSGGPGTLIDIYINFPNPKILSGKQEESMFHEIYGPAQNGNTEALGYLTKFYLYGIGTEKNIDMAIQTAMDKYKADSLFPNYIGYLYQQKGSSGADGAFKWYSLAVNSKDSDYGIALRNLSACYSNGTGTERDTLKSLEYLKESAEVGNTYSMFYLGQCYWFGSTAKEDKKSGTKWIEKAANEGNDLAQGFLGNLYLVGFGGVEKDSAKAFYWLQKSALQGNAGALNDLGECYYIGCGTKKDFEKARYYYQLSANKNEPIGKLSLGVLYLNGEGVPKDLIKAKALFEDACEEKIQEACDKLKELN
jgi:TPR repeat protein